MPSSCEYMYLAYAPSYGQENTDKNLTVSRLFNLVLPSEKMGPEVNTIEQHLLNYNNCFETNPTCNFWRNVIL